MAEELAELGFTGLEKFTDKYYEKAYDRLPPLPKPGKKKQQQQQRQQGQNGYQPYPQAQPARDQEQYPSQYDPRHPDKGYPKSRSGPPADVDGYQDDPEMYAPDRRQDRYNDDRYYEDEQVDRRAPGPGFRVPRGSGEHNGTSGQAVAPYQQQSQRGYDQGRDMSTRARPAPERRGSSWSPPRSERPDGRESRRRRSNSRSSSRGDRDSTKHRLIAAVGGALVGGLAGNQATKGKKYDTVATVAGAVLGGIGAREASSRWDDRKQEKKQKASAWEGDHSDDDRRHDRRKDDRYGRDDRYDRDDRRRY